jgi:hypothetical protein
VQHTIFSLCVTHFGSVHIWPGILAQSQYQEHGLVWEELKLALAIVFKTTTQHLTQTKPHFNLVPASLLVNVQEMRMLFVLILQELLLLVLYSAQPAYCSDIGCIGEKGDAVDCTFSLTLP